MDVDWAENNTVQRFKLHLIILKYKYYFKIISAQPNKII